LRRFLTGKGCADTWVQIDKDHPTGTVNVNISDRTNVQYEIIHPVAWDLLRQLMTRWKFQEMPMPLYLVPWLLEINHPGKRSSNCLKIQMPSNNDVESRHHIRCIRIFKQFEERFPGWLISRSQGTKYKGIGIS